MQDKTEHRRREVFPFPPDSPCWSVRDRDIEDQTNPEEYSVQRVGGD